MYINRNFMSELNNKIKNALGQDLVLKIKALFNLVLTEEPDSPLLIVGNGIIFFY